MTARRGLRDYLRDKAAAMTGAARRRPLGTDWHETVEATCVADDATGTRKVTTGGHRYISDSGPDFGGWQLGPSSPELLCAVVSTCLTHTYLIGAASMGLGLDRVEVRVTAENNDARFVGVDTADPPLPFNLTAHVSVEPGDTLPPDLAALHRYVEENCPLTRLIREPGSVSFVRHPDGSE